MVCHLEYDVIKEEKNIEVARQVLSDQRRPVYLLEVLSD